MMHTDAPPRRHWEHGAQVIQDRNTVAYERLRRLIYSDQGYTLGPYGLGPHRSLRDYEIFSGFNFKQKRAHPDVFTGANPDPVTIHNPEDWTQCISMEEAALQWP